MTKFHIAWKKNVSVMPDDPVKMAKLNLSLLEMVKADLKLGSIADWGNYCNGFSGYCLKEGTEADILLGLLKYMPYVLFDVRPVVNVDQSIDAINKVVAQSKTK
jgi:hypothetical protein